MPFITLPPDGGAASADEQRTAYQAALLRERDGYIARGNADGVADVEAALVASGFELVERAVEPPTPRARATKSKG